MELLNSLQALWNEYWPMLMTIGGSIIAIAGSVYLVYTQAMNVIRPIKEWIEERKSKETEELIVIEDTLKNVDLEVKIQDLKEKINNPLTSEEGRKLYTAQLEILIKTKAITETTTETTSKYS